MSIRSFVVSLLAFLSAISVAAETPKPMAQRWTLDPDGGISWQPKRGEAHEDNIEMSGKQLSAIISYGVDAQGSLKLSRLITWPMLRFEPQNTRSHLQVAFGADAEPRVFLDRKETPQRVPARVSLHGLIRVEGVYGANGNQAAFVRTIFPSIDKPFLIERTEITNTSSKPITVEIEPNDRRIETNPARGVYGGYLVMSHVEGAGERRLQPGETTTFSLQFSARQMDAPEIRIDPVAEAAARRARVARVLAEMRLETPEPELNAAFAFAKIRATESIYATKGGLMHGPGGGAYYAAIWANDQAEYAGPFFAMLADPDAREAGLNTFRHFARFMNPEYKPIPSSIIAEGVGFWNGAGDRGDMAMIAYGAARFALARGDRQVAQELWPLIDWCHEYCRRQITPDGVVGSDSDELENRFPSGKANLCTSALYYDALITTAHLAKDLGQPSELSENLNRRAGEVRAAIEKYFGATVEGFATYRYFDKSFPSSLPRHAHYANEPDHLRAWICIPLTVGIYDRAKATVDALFSPQLWTADGLATEAGQITFWDRSTLYALRGVLASGDTSRALDYLRYYTNRRLRGDHVPYPVEAFPEGNQRHLSAESALYCRIYTEGLFGLCPTGLNSFSLTPRLPDGWATMALRDVHAFGATFDLEVKRAGSGVTVLVTPNGQPSKTFTVPAGECIAVELQGSTP